MEIHVLGCPEHNFRIYIYKMSVCKRNYVATVAKKLWTEQWNFTFSWISTKIGADYILMHITSEILLMLEIFDFFNAAIFYGLILLSL